MEARILILSKVLKDLAKYLQSIKLGQRNKDITRYTELIKKIKDSSRH